VPAWHVLVQKGDQIGQWSLDTDPLKSDEVSGTLKTDPDREIWTVEGEVAPGTQLNPTKGTPSFVERLDAGDVTILEDGDIFKKYEFRGKELKGLWTARRSSPTDTIWRFERSTEVSANGGGSDRSKAD